MIASLLPVASKLLGKFIEDKDTKNKLAHEIATMAEKHAQQIALELMISKIFEIKSYNSFIQYLHLANDVCELTLPSCLYFFSGAHKEK